MKAITFGKKTIAKGSGGLSKNKFARLLGETECMKPENIKARFASTGLYLCNTRKKRIGRTNGEILSAKSGKPALCF